MDSAVAKTVKMHLEGPVHWPPPRTRKRLLSQEPDCDKRRKVCEGQEVRAVAGGVRSQGSQTRSVAFTRLPVASCCSLPVPWGVQRSSSVSASTQTLSRDRPSSVDDLCDLDVELLEDDVFLAEDTAPDVFLVEDTSPDVYGSQEAMAAILDTLMHLMEQGVSEPLTHLCSGLALAAKEQDVGEDRRPESPTRVEGVVAIPLGGRRHVATNTTNVPTRVTTTMAPRRKSWRKASRHWHSIRARSNSSTQTD